jgi:hypothetical protein
MSPGRNQKLDRTFSHDWLNHIISLPRDPGFDAGVLAEALDLLLPAVLSFGSGAAR